MSSRKKTVCLVIHSLQAGGMERVMSELANYFAQRPDVNVHLVLYGMKRDIFYDIDPAISVHRPAFAFNDKLRLLSTLRTILWLRATIKKIDPITVLSFGEFWNNLVLIALRGMKVPIFISDRSQPDKSLGRLHEKLRSILYPGATGIIAQTTVAKEIYVRKYSHKNITVIGNPIRAIKSAPEHRDNIVLMVGRLIRSKNQDRLIRIFAQTHMREWKLVIVGYDHLKQENEKRLKSLAKELDIENQVEFAGKQSDVESYYRRASIFAFTSSSEGFPNVVGEAMSAGLPVISYDCVAGPSDLITNDEDGYLIPLFDDDMFAQKLRNLMSDEELRAKLGSRAAVNVKKFDLHTIGERFYDFITHLN